MTEASHKKQPSSRQAGGDAGKHSGAKKAPAMPDRNSPEARKKRASVVRVARAKQDISVEVIRQNQLCDDLMKRADAALAQSDARARKLAGQREIVTRINMTARTLRTLIRLLAQNRLQLWMIDDNAINDEE